MHTIDLWFIWKPSNNLDIFNIDIKSIKYNYLDIL